MTTNEEVPRELRLIIKVRKDAKMSPKKLAAQAVHAALKLVGSHHRGPVIVLDGTKTQIEDCEVFIIDEGRTEVKHGTVTAGAFWDERPVPDYKLEQWAHEGREIDKRPDLMYCSHCSLMVYVDQTQDGVCNHCVKLKAEGK
jgi:peptidyl-tRNA hydrolase